MNEKRWQIRLLVVLLALRRLESIGYISRYFDPVHILFYQFQWQMKPSKELCSSSRSS